MAKRKSKASSSRQQQVLLAIVVLIILAVLVGITTGWDHAAVLVGDALGVDLRPLVGVETTPGAGTTVQEPISGSGDFYQVYFTDPPLNSADAVSSGGIETHLIDLIDGAQSTIDAAMFEFDLEDVAQALIRAHQRGVQVRLVYDNEHTEGDPQIDEVMAAGIPATPDERSAFMHDKFYVFDGKTVWTGSTNITENGMYRNNNNSIVINSEALAANYTAEFEEMFNGEFGPTSPASTPNPRVQIGDTLIENYFSPEDGPLARMLEVTGTAQQSIHFMSFSFTDYDLAKVMMDRMDAGVEVSGIFETRGANTEYSECPTLLDHGAAVRLDANPGTFHHKVVIVDGKIVMTGSFNYSTNATESNDENVLIIYNEQIARLYEQEFAKQYAVSRVPVGGECLSDG